MKKFLKIFSIVLGSILLLIVVFFLLGWKMIGTIQAESGEIRTLDLAGLPDGVYRGSAGDFIVTVDLSVEVKAHRIANIQINKQLCSGKHKALDTIERIIDTQSADVDVTAGATWSSKTIMAAAYKALEKK